MTIGEGDVLGRGSVARRMTHAVAGVAGAVLIAMVCASCTPKDTYHVTNSTDETVDVHGEEIRPGTTREFDLVGRCDTASAYTDGHERVASASVCADETWTIRNSDFDAGHWATVRNETGADVEVWFAGHESVDGERLRPGGEMVLPLVAEDDVEAWCAAAPDGRSVLWVEYQSPEGDSRSAYRWGEVCEGDRWVIDDAALSDSGAVLTVVNDTGMAMRVSVWIGDRPPTGSRDGRISGELGALRTLEVPLRLPPDECVAGGISGTTVEGDELLGFDEDITLCGGTFAISEATLKHQVGGQWVPLDYDPSEWTGAGSARRGELPPANA